MARDKVIRIRLSEEELAAAEEAAKAADRKPSDFMRLCILKGIRGKTRREGGKRT